MAAQVIFVPKMRVLILALTFFYFCYSQHISLSREFAGLHVKQSVIDKLKPLPTVSPDSGSRRRVGAQRWRQFGPRCWDEESCEECVCCGYCNSTNFCVSPSGSVDICRAYEYLAMYTDIEKPLPEDTFTLPTDFPLVP